MTTKLAWTVVATTALLALAACGGGGGGEDRDEVATVPASALGSPEAFSQWVGAREASESREPLAMEGVMPPTSETAEPIDID